MSWPPTFIVAVMILSGCNTGGKTYVQEAPILPETPTNGTNILVTSDDGSTSALSYTDVGPGAILIQQDCSSSETCGLNVYEATPVEEANTTEP